LPELVTRVRNWADGRARNASVVRKAAAADETRRMEL
jgi:hypothetical protein